MRRAAITLERPREWVLIFLMVALTVVVIVAVVYRKAGASLSWYDEVAAIQLAWVSYYGAALAALKRRHIGFDGVLLSIPMPGRMAAVVAAEIPRPAAAATISTSSCCTRRAGYRRCNAVR